MNATFIKNNNIQRILFYVIKICNVHKSNRQIISFKIITVVYFYNSDNDNLKKLYDN